MEDIKKAVEKAKARLKNKEQEYASKCPYCGDMALNLSTFGGDEHHKIACGRDQWDEDHKINCPIAPETPWMKDPDKVLELWNNRPEQEEADKALVQLWEEYRKEQEEKDELFLSKLKRPPRIRR